MANGQPFAAITRPDEQPLGPPPPGAPGADPNARVNAINQLAAAGRAPAAGPQIDVTDPTNLFAPSTGQVADRFRSLQAMFAGQMEDVPPLSAPQIIALTLSSFSAPEAAFTVLQNRQEEKNRRARERRALNARLFEFATRSVEHESEMALRTSQLKMQELQLAQQVARNRLLETTSASENALRAAQIARIQAETAEIRGANGSLANAIGDGSFEGPGGMRMQQMTVKTARGNISAVFKADDPLDKQILDLQLDILQKSRGEVQLSTSEAGGMLMRAREEAGRLSDYAEISPGAMTDAPQRVKSPYGTGAAERTAGQIDALRREKPATAGEAIEHLGQSYRPPFQQLELRPGSPGLEKRRRQLQIEAARLEQLEQAGKISSDQADRLMLQRMQELGLEEDFIG